jgi:hypothetical protein
MSEPKRRQPQKRYFDPGAAPMGRPKPLPVGKVTVAKLTRQLRRQFERRAGVCLEHRLTNCATCHPGKSR